MDALASVAVPLRSDMVSCHVGWNSAVSVSSDGEDASMDSDSSSASDEEELCSMPSSPFLTASVPSAAQKSRGVCSANKTPESVSATKTPDSFTENEDYEADELGFEDNILDATQEISGDLRRLSRPTRTCRSASSSSSPIPWRPGQTICVDEAKELPHGCLKFVHDGLSFITAPISGHLPAADKVIKLDIGGQVVQHEILLKNRYRECRAESQATDLYDVLWVVIYFSDDAEAFKQLLPERQVRLLDGTVRNFGRWPYMYPILGEAAVRGRLNIARYLVEDLKCDPNVRHGKGHRSAIHLAAFYGWTDIVRLLLANGAKARTRDNRGESPIEAALFSRYFHIADLLREALGAQGCSFPQPAESSRTIQPKPKNSFASHPSTLPPKFPSSAHRPNKANKTQHPHARAGQQPALPSQTGSSISSRHQPKQANKSQCLRVQAGQQTAVLPSGSGSKPKEGNPTAARAVPESLSAASQRAPQLDVGKPSTVPVPGTATTTTTTTTSASTAAATAATALHGARRQELRGRGAVQNSDAPWMQKRAVRSEGISGVGGPCAHGEERRGRGGVQNSDAPWTQKRALALEVGSLTGTSTAPGTTGTGATVKPKEVVMASTAAILPTPPQTAAGSAPSYGVAWGTQRSSKSPVPFGTRTRSDADSDWRSRG